MGNLAFVKYQEKKGNFTCLKMGAIIVDVKDAILWI
jgi:hypothetical protein